MAADDSSGEHPPVQASEERPRVGISRCLLGETVRYDGGDKRAVWILEAFENSVDWEPLCPEVEFGLSTPREPMRLELDDRAPASPRLRTHSGSSDLTEEFREWTAIRVAELARLGLDGLILKSHSPSCGPGDAELWHEGVAAGVTDGLFAAELRAALPRLPLASEIELHEERARSEFLARVLEYHRDRRGGR